MQRFAPPQEDISFLQATFGKPWMGTLKDSNKLHADSCSQSCVLRSRSVTFKSETGARKQYSFIYRIWPSEPVGAPTGRLSELSMRRMRDQKYAPFER